MGRKIIQRSILDKAIVKFNGGLGNQMFQYAFAYTIAKRFGLETLFDFRFFEDVKKTDIATNREFELHAFDIECKEATEEDFDKIVFSKRQSKFQKFLWQKLKLQKFEPDGNDFLQKNSYLFDKTLFEKPYYYYNGYFQNEKYFKEQRDNLINCFSLKIPLDEQNQKVLDKINETNSVSIHIRRGDYVTLENANKFHGTCSLEYYQKAIEYISKWVQSPHFFVFSDDIDWVIKNLKIEYPMNVIDFNQNKDWFDLELMKNCKHNITANSSFSWWGAWLNQNPNKIVIAPKHWTAQPIKCDIIPKEWIKL